MITAIVSPWILFEPRRHEGTEKTQSLFFDFLLLNFDFLLKF